MNEASFIGEYSSVLTPVIPLRPLLEVSIHKQKQVYILPINQRENSPLDKKTPTLG